MSACSVTRGEESYRWRSGLSWTLDWTKQHVECRSV